jgi:uncharacterized membrane protein
MESKTKIFGHPIHPMLIVFPLGLFITSVVFDIIYLINGAAQLPPIAYYNILAGIVMGLLAAIFGFRDWTAIPAGTRAKSVGAAHGLGNVVVVALMAGSWLLRQNSADFVPGTLGYLLSFAGVGVGAISAWLGGELVDRLGVGVDRGANLNAPSSLSGEPAIELPVMPGSAVPVTGSDKYTEKYTDKLSSDLPSTTTNVRLDDENRRENDNLD